MSDERRPRYWGRRLISIGFALTGLVLAGTAVFMVWTFGEGLGATPSQQIAYAVAHVALHAFGMLAAFSIAIFLIDRSRAWAALAIILALGVGGYGISNIAGFSAKNRLSVSDAVRENDRRAMQRYEAAKSDLAQKRDWAAGQSMSFEHSRYERLQFKGKEREYQKMLDELKMPQVTAATVNADAGASVVARVFGSSDEDWQVRFAVMIAVLMFIGEFFSFILSGRMWPTAATVAALRRKISGSSEDGGENVKTSEAPKAKLPENVTPLRAEAAQFQAPVAPPIAHFSEKEGQDRENVRRVELGAPSPYLKGSPRQRVHEVLRLADQPFASLTALAAASGASLATTSRAVRDLAGKGKLQKGRKGRSLQITKTYNGGTYHAFGA